MTGRPCSYTSEIAAEFCFRLAQGISLRTICNDDDMPDGATIFRWMQRTDEIGTSFREQYARAKEASSDAMAEDIQAISDNPDIPSDHKRIMVDTRKWLASKLKPKRYGDKLAVGGDTDMGPVQVTWAQPSRTALTDDSNS